MTTTTVTVERRSKADRLGPANTSPFRSALPGRRLIAAEEMVAIREEELAGLEAILATTTDRRKHAAIALRIRATRNNLQSWLDYLDEDAPREPRAVITPWAHRSGALRIVGSFMGVVKRGVVHASRPNTYDPETGRAVALCRSNIRISVEHDNDRFTGDRTPVEANVAGISCKGCLNAVRKQTSQAA